MTIRRLLRSDPRYPPLLAAIHDPPSSLWLRGEAEPALLSQTTVAVVGARACSGYGRAVARSLARVLGAAGVVVSSGLARGIDAEAHRGALEAGGLTVAVLGCGIDRDYPAAHAELGRRIVESGGLIVSEYEAGVEPAPWRFPARNRIIAGLCRATVVVEARERSGALITADFALEDGREVLAVPGEITSALSAGTNGLLRLGATPVTCAEDVLESLGIDPMPMSGGADLDGASGAVLEALRPGAATADELVRLTGLDPGAVAGALVELELSGRVSIEDGEVRSSIAHVTSLWLDHAPAMAPARLLERDAEIAIVGGGITGCAAAYVLARAGRRVRLYEAREIAGGASGRNGGFALRGMPAPFDVTADNVGEERTRELWEWTESSMKQLAALAGAVFRPLGSLRIGADEEEREELRREYDGLRRAGLEAEWLDDLDGPLAGRFAGAIRHPMDGALQPAVWVRRLAGLAADAGAELREHTRLESIEDARAPVVLVATDGYPSGLLGELEGLIIPTRGQIVATEPIPERWYEVPHYGRHGFDYWHQTPEGRIVAGGFRDTTLATEFTADEVITSPVQGALEAFVQSIAGRKLRVDYRWAGIFGTVMDFLPVVGRVPGLDGVWVAGGYSGHGNVLGFACGQLAANAILGEEAPFLDLFEPARLAAL